jgi:hypothetical protein
MGYGMFISAGYGQGFSLRLLGTTGIPESGLFWLSHYFFSGSGVALYSKNSLDYISYNPSA